MVIGVRTAVFAVLVLALGAAFALSARAAELPLCEGPAETSSARLRWRVPTGTVTGYRLYWSAVPNDWNNDAVVQGPIEIPASVASPGAQITANVEIRLPKAAVSYVVLSARNADVEGSISNGVAVPATCRHLLPPPGIPQGLEVLSITVVLPDGTTREISAEELRSLLP